MARKNPATVLITVVMASAIVLVNFVPAAWPQAPSATTPAIDNRAEAILKQLSLEEKIDLIGGAR